MIKYLIQDLKWALHYLPYGLIAAGLFFLFFFAQNTRRMKLGKETKPLLSSVGLCISLLIIFFLTLLTRENGSTTKVDLEIGSTLRINARNSAYVVENILLFIPYGFCLAWRFGCKRKWMNHIFLGFATTFAVEYIQLVTGRGVFQIDDILTNGVGCVVGLAIFCMGQWLTCNKKSCTE